MLKQALLQRQNIQLVTWIPSNLSKKNRYIIETKSGIKWKILCVYNEIELDIEDINKDWRVGGL